MNAAMARPRMPSAKATSMRVNPPSLETRLTFLFLLPIVEILGSDRRFPVVDRGTTGQRVDFEREDCGVAPRLLRKIDKGALRPPTGEEVHLGLPLGEHLVLVGREDAVEHHFSVELDRLS